VIISLLFLISSSIIILLLNFLSFFPWQENDRALSFLRHLVVDNMVHFVYSDFPNKLNPLSFFNVKTVQSRLLSHTQKIYIDPSNNIAHCTIRYFRHNNVEGLYVLRFLYHTQLNFYCNHTKRCSTLNSGNHGGQVIGLHQLILLSACLIANFSTKMRWSSIMLKNQSCSPFKRKKIWTDLKIIDENIYI